MVGADGFGVRAHALKLACALLLVILPATFLSGCAAGMVDTAPQRKRRIRNIVALEFRQLNDDWDSFWMLDKPSRMTYWHLREAD